MASQTMSKAYRVYHKLDTPYSVLLENRNIDDTLMFESNAVAVLCKILEFVIFMLNTVNQLGGLAEVVVVSAAVIHCQCSQWEQALCLDFVVIWDMELYFVDEDWNAFSRMNGFVR